ncbi:MAG: SCP2 sterol-binding domain-containing protein [Promethearchaeota archaeon]|jgi:putative sterol carrier protein
MLKYEGLLKLSANFTKEFCETINKSLEYYHAAKGWGVGFEGSLLWLMSASGEIKDDVKIYLNLKDGKCLGIKLLAPNEDPPRNPILILRAPLNIWKEMRTKRIKPNQFIMSGRLKIEGNISTIMRYSKAATELGKLAGRQTFFKKLFTEYDLG